MCDLATVIRHAPMAMPCGLRSSWCRTARTPAGMRASTSRSSAAARSSIPACVGVCLMCVDEALVLVSQAHTYATRGPGTLYTG
jgi:hypothetical protein